jgi:hypothetical protein
MICVLWAIVGAYLVIEEKKQLIVVVTLLMVLYFIIKIRILKNVKIESDHKIK